MSTERLIIELDARTAKLDAKLAATDRKLDKMDGSVKRTDISLKSFGKSAMKARGAVLALGAVLGVGVFTRYADQIQMAENQLKSVTESTEEFNAVQDELRRIAGETRQSLSELTSVYARFKRAGEEAGFTIQETLDLTEALTKAMKIEGNTTSEVNSVLLQLTQSFRSGRISGEEFRAVSEGSTIVLKSLATQLGVTTGQLKEMAAQGLVTPEALISGLKGAEEEISKQFTELEPTFAEVGTAMGRVFTAAYDDSIAESTSSSLKGMLLSLGADMERFFSGEETLTESGLQKRMDAVADRILELKIQFNELADKDMVSVILNTQIAIQTDKLQGLQERLAALQTSDPVSILMNSGTEDPRIQREKDFALAVLEIQNEKTQTLEERFMHEAEVHKLALDNKLINEREYQKSVNESAKKFVEAKKTEEKADKDTTAKKINRQEASIGAAMALNTLLFDDNKAIAAGLIVADTATAIMRSLSIAPYDYFNVGIIAATGAAQLANALSSSKGGGASSGASGGGSPQQQTQPDFQPETSSLELSDSTEGGSQSINITVPDGDEIGQAIANWLTKAQSEGRA